MKLFPRLVLLFSVSGFTQTFALTKGKSTYEVKHLLKRVSGTSEEVKGKLVCEGETCEFLVAVPVKSFVSSDANRDSNMQTYLESGKFPVTSASGTIASKALASAGSLNHEVKVTFHGVQKTYQVTSKVLSPYKLRSSITVKLDQHGVERPSLFGVSIDDEVPVTFDLEWKM